jgi:hypothetical protein
MVKHNAWFGAAVYQIKVRGTLGSNWSDWFDGISINTEGAVTTITGNIPDQSALHGVLARIRDLGLPLISVERVETNENV